MSADEPDEVTREPSGEFKHILSKWTVKEKSLENDVASNPFHIAGQAYRKDHASKIRKNISDRKLRLSMDSHDDSLPAQASPHETRSSKRKPKYDETIVDADEDSSSHSTGDKAPSSKGRPNPASSSSKDQSTESGERSTVGTDATAVEGSGSPTSWPVKKGIADRVGIFDNISKETVALKKAGNTPRTDVKKLSPAADKSIPKTVDEKESLSTPEDMSSPSKPAPNPTEEEEDQPSALPSEIPRTKASGANNWAKAKRVSAKLKVVGIAARASVRLQQNRLQKKKANIYQKPLENKPGFKPPKFEHTKDEMAMIKTALKKNFVFSDLRTRDLMPLMEAFQECKFKAKERIINQGEPGDYFYVIYEGKVVFEVNGKAVGKAGPGKSFGELALLYTCPRAASVIAHKDSTLFRVDNATFRYILQNQTSESEKQKVKLLKGVEFFAPLSSPDIEKLSKVMTPRVFTPDDILVKKGDLGDAFYVIQEGEILIKDISVGSTTYEDQKLGPGEYFGERSLMTSEPRAANAVALTYGVAFFINRSTFENVIGKVADLVSKAQDSRRLAGVTMLQPANLSKRQLLAVAQMLKDMCYNTGAKILKKDDMARPALFFVREGRVKVESNGKSEEFVAGGYFGEDLFTKGITKRSPRVRSPITVTCVEAAKLAELSLQKCRSIFDVETLLTGREVEQKPDKKEETKSASSPAKRQKSLEYKAPPRPKLQLEQLKKVKLLGAGTFGQVWLVSDKTKPEAKEVYALKVQTKHNLVEEGQVKAVIQERNIMDKISHPFIVDFIASFKDKHFIYMVVRLLQGGELFSRVHDIELDRDGLSESQTKFYAFCLADAIAYLHRSGYVFRDLKSENVMLDTQGYPKLIDFGFAKKITEKTFTLCGTPGYLPPEIVMTRGHDWSADHWSFGILIYDMLTGHNPFFYEGMDQMTLFQSIVQDDFEDPEGVSPEAKDIIRKLLEKEPVRRLGSLSRGEEDILEHLWFADLDLAALRRRDVEAPWVPVVKDPLDTCCFDDWSHLVDKMDEKLHELNDKDEALFDAF